ncbi:uncharacterized protein LTR77_008986 [Saxophila tyrrhenica]|uniref:alpha-L-rhamnosidase n=1 Tax=Saxophila tyrrhenica TaxID=1690608 RepID=A0AAV9P358_9PEZI|nr:hypothetical protein LTR77_008986 [Saxophila tyrrhenica]
MQRPSILRAALWLVWAAAASQASPVTVTQLSVDGRLDSPLGLDDVQPTLSWQMIQHEACEEKACPGDRQTAFEVRAAATMAGLQANKCIWTTGRIESSQQQVRFDGTLASRDTIAWQVRVWNANNDVSDWSAPSTWTMGLLEQADWGESRWISYPDRTEDQPLPIFVRQFEVDDSKTVAGANLYLSGIGLIHPTVNGEDITDEVLAPGYSNYQLSTEYRTYDVSKCLRAGSNSLGVSLGNGVAYIRRSVTNRAVGRDAPYAWWESQLQGDGLLADAAEAGSTSVRLNNVTLYHLGGTINIDTANGGHKLESRVITAIHNRTKSIDFTPALELSHEDGVNVTGSGNNIAATDPSAGAAVSPRLIARLEITYEDGGTDVVVTDRSWRTAFGPFVTDQWYSGPDYDARREHSGWDLPNPELSDSWVSAGIVPPPNLATKLVARAAEPVRIQERITPVSMKQPFPGTWVFDFGQNFAGWALLTLPEMPAGVTVKVAPSESLNANGTIEQSSLGPSSGPGSRGSDLFYTYTTAGREGGESWRPKFNYFGMQWVQVTGLPNGFEPSLDLITGLRLQGDVPTAGTFTSSNARVNRIHNMVSYSFASNLMSTFTDCPGREKLSYPADYVMPMGAIYRHFHLSAFMRTTMRTLVEGQSIADTYMFGNVALKTPVYDWGYTRQFGDEINWGDAIVLVPSILHDLDGDTTLMAENYDHMVDFVDYIQREKVEDNLVLGPLADWVEDRPETSGYITGTWGYYNTIQAMARMANITGHTADAERYAALAVRIRSAFNAAFFDDESGRYRNNGSIGVSNATQAAQALALDSGLVEEENRASVLQALVDLTYSYGPKNESGPHLSGGTIGLNPIIRALSDGGRDDVLWQALQQNEQPSYGYFLKPTPENPMGLTTIRENWDISASKNHMILAQIEEWFHAGLAGLRPLALRTLSGVEEEGLVFQPKIVGDLTSAEATYMMQAGEARSRWSKNADGILRLTVTIPSNTVAEVRVPVSKGEVKASGRAELVRSEYGYEIFSVPSGTHDFVSRVEA